MGAGPGNTMAEPEQDRTRLGTGKRLDPETGLPLPTPYPEYLTCSHCGEPEVEVWCFESVVVCHNCGGLILHQPALDCEDCKFCQQDQGDVPDA